MTRINTNTLNLFSPMVMYSPYYDEFFLQTGTLYRTPGEYEDPEDICQEHEEENFKAYPLDEHGAWYENLQLCVPVGRKVDTTDYGRYNEYVVRLLNESRAFDFEIVCRSKSCR